MRRLGFILLTGICLLVFVVPIRSQEISDIYTDSLSVDSFAIDSFDPDPEWYVAPEVRGDYIRASKRANANTCPKDSVLIFNIDSVLVEVTVYEYSGDTTRTMVWTVNTDGSRFGTSKTEEASTATGTFHATYSWDDVTYDWKGTAREEHTYAGTKETARLLYTWLNNAWVADTKYTWTYDAAGREHEYTTYNRNQTTNELVLSQQRIRVWYNNTKLTSEIQYTAHDGTGWYAGTKKEYDYDAAGNQIEYTYYSSLSNGNWIGSIHEVWTYTSGKKTYYEKQTWSNGWVNNTKEIWEFNGPSAKQTLHEKYNGSNTDWTLALQENLGYDEAGNNTLVENYSLTNNVWKGTKKEEYTYVGTNKTGTITYNWNADNNAFVYKTWSINNTAENPNEKCSYNWVNDAWVGTGTRKLTTKTGGKTTEVITQTWPSGSIVWVNKTCTTTIYVGDNKTQETYYDWSNDTWVGTKRTDYTFNADGINIMTHNAKWQNNAWVMTSMTRTDISDETIDGVHQISYTQWQCGADSVWKGVQKDTTSYYITAENTQNPLYSASFSSMVNNAWVPSYKIEHEYDEADREILNRRMDWVNNKWQGHYLYEYEYDDQGQRTSYTYYDDWDSSTNSWKGSSKYDYAYASNGQYSQQVMYRWKNNQWVGLFQYFYRYDAANHEIEQLVQSYSNDAWQNSQLYIHEYRGSEVIKNNEYRWRNEQWQFTRRNEKIYDNDAQAKLRQEISGSWNTNGIATSFTNKLYSYGCDPRTIRFVNYDGTLLETQTLDKGVTPSYSGAEPTRESNAEYTYTFSGWNPDLAPVTSNVTYTATFTAKKNTYTIAWKNEDGTLIDQTTAEYGTMPTHEDASKANTAEYTYEFTGWTPGLGIVTGDATYTASFKETKNSYTITWLNSDNSPLATNTVEYGQMPAEPTTPTKQSTAEYSYTFSGWTPEIVSVTGNATYTATFEATKRKYTVTWLNEDGSILEQEELEFGTTPAHADINKENTAEYTYEFAGWTPTILPVVSNISYQATFTATKNSYTITFKDEDGSVISSANVVYGAMPVEPTAPTKPADSENTYTFAGWTPTVVAVTGEATYTATYISTTNSYTITFKNEDGTTISTASVEYGTMPVAPSAPNKQSTAEYTYTFSGWTPTIAEVTGDATYTATFTATKNKYLVTFKDEDGTTLKSEELEYGVTPTAPADPTKAATGGYMYTFSGWDKEVVSVTGEATYTATFTATKNSYTITWKNDDGSIIASETLEYGTTPTHADINKESTAEWTYTFAGWSPEIVPVTGDAVYTATFTATKNKYLITFKDEDGSILKSEELEYGVMPTAPANPTKAATAEWTYTFAGWDKEIISVAEATTYTATYTATKNSYTITWKNDDGSIIESETLAYGATPAHANIYKESTAEWTYTFTGWTPQITAVTGDAEYTALFDSTVNQYTVTFYWENGTTILRQMQLSYGELPTISVIPARNADNQCSYYSFAGWEPEIVPVTGNASYMPTYTEHYYEYMVTFRNYDRRELQRSKQPCGFIPNYEGATPTKPGNAQYSYVFTGWTPELTELTGEAIYTATFEKRENIYTIVFLDEDGTELDRQSVNYGAVPTPSVTPVKEEDEQYTYTFAGWSPQLKRVTGDATYTATYKSTAKTEGINGTEVGETATKVIIDNQIFIRRGGNIYTIDGQMVQ